MRRFSVAKQFEINPQKSDRVTTVMRMFGVGIDRLKDQQTTHECTVEVNDGDIVYITGPSGAGKSVLLREMQTAVPDDEKIIIEQIALPADKPAIDCVGGKGTIDGLSLLSYAGLSDVFCMLNAPANLSEGQKYRFRLACALASGKKFIFADEFCSNLDRITAGVIAYNVRRFAKHNGVTFFLASAHEDILADLQPDVLVVKSFAGEAEVTYKARQVRPV
ncbi:MAG: ATP-binding cassette domain-containing protein [Sedimentisphaerales bacterium]|jgi:ABC-type ATPase with predicted acetyltransferase domain